jgi:prophage tail gpP-like protein
MAVVDNAVSLIIKGQAFGGWQAVRVTRSAERCPSDYDLLVTEKYPGQAAQIDIRPFDSCQVKIGPDLVLTGWVDRYAADYSATNHTIRIQGRSLCEDLVDCSADIVGAQMSGVSALSLAQQLAAPYNIKVTSLVGPGEAIPQFNVSLGETPYEIIERIARHAALLAYDGTDGNLILAQAGGGGTMASGFQQGVNGQSASVIYSGDERFSVYVAVMMAIDSLHDLGASGNLLGTATDPTVPRFRKRIIISEQIVNGQSVALARARWEMARRIGRSQALRVTCDSWRDSAGKLWTPNAYASVNFPALKLAPSTPWVIGEVSYIKDAERGTVADLLLMPKDAFLPEPSVLQLYDWQVGQALADAGNTEAPGP